MGLKFATPPAGGMEIVASALAQLARLRPAPEVAAAGAGSPPERRLVSPQEVYFLGLDALAGAKPLAAATHVGWRYLVVEGDRAVEAAESTTGDGGPLRFSLVSRGPQVQGFVDAIHVAEALADAEPGPEWVLRCLRIPALYVDAVWLADPHGRRTQDRLIPIAPVFPPLVANHVYTPAEFFRTLLPSAKKRLAHADPLTN